MAEWIGLSANRSCFHISTRPRNRFSAPGTRIAPKRMIAPFTAWYGSARWFGNVFMRNRFGYGIAILLCAALWASGCQRREISALRVGNGAEPQDLDPHVVSGVLEHRILSTLFEGLVDCDPGDLHIMPAVAESWTVSDDGRQYVFQLRHDALWSNGDPVVAEDFVYAWRRILTPALGAQYAQMLYCLKNARAYHEGTLDDFGKVGVHAIDSKTLEVTLENPTPYFLSMQIHFAWYPVHRGTIERFGAIASRNSKWTRPGNLVGNGAYRLNRWVPNNYIEVVKNERYWNAHKVRLPRIVYWPMDNAFTEERSFRTGALHLTENVPLLKVPAYRRDHPEQIHLDPYFGSYFYRINVTRPPLNDVRVRRALAMAIDRKAITTRVLTGGQRPAGTLTPPGVADYVCDAGIEFDPAGARRLLSEAGYPGGRGFPGVEILYNTSESHKIIAEAIQDMWKTNLNISAQLLNQDWKVYLASQRTLDYSVARASWIGDYADPNTFLECFRSDNGNNNTGWTSAAYDTLLDEAAQTPDPAARLDRLREAERILLDECPIIPIYYYTRVYLKSPEVKGWKSNILGYISFKDLYFEDAAQ